MLLNVEIVGSEILKSLIFDTGSLESDFLAISNLQYFNFELGNVLFTGDCIDIAMRILSKWHQPSIFDLFRSMKYLNIMKDKGRM